MSQDTIAQLLTISDASDLTEDQVRCFKDNPSLMTLVGDRETLGLRNLWRILWIAAALVAVSKIIAVKLGDEVDQFLINVASDLVFEMGAALIGSVATVIFIEYQNRRQFTENMEFRTKLQQRIKELSDKDTENAQ
ncbi:MAG: hypothetical protein P8Q92_06040 [Pseudoprimorskyibacter sp.]|nr:hypothetical protein [Pseudoprimorskyibacter sp.]